MKSIAVDIALLGVAVTLVSLYSYLVLGSFSPVHFRFVTGLIGMSCVLISITAAYAGAFAMGLKVTSFHNILPFMIIGVGVDNIFIVIYAIDQ